MNTIIQFLRANQWNHFYQSLLSQYSSKGYLSEAQVNRVREGMERAAKPHVKPEFSLKTGAMIEVKGWIARRLKDDLNLPYFFRNLEVTEVVNETPKAYQVKVKFVSRIVTSCHVCGKDLDTEISKATGIGPTCAKKLGLERPTLATAHETLKAIDALCTNLGEVGAVWIPKSQILKTAI